MKIIYIVFCISFLSFYNSLSQELETKLDSTRDENGRYVLSFVISSSDTTLVKEKLFEAIKISLYKKFGPKSKSITYENKDEGVILFTNSSPRLDFINTSFLGTKERSNGGYFIYECKIICKDKKLKVSFLNITHVGGKLINMRDGSDYGDQFPSTWTMFAKKMTYEQWPLMKKQGFTHFLSFIEIFKREIYSKKSENDF